MKWVKENKELVYVIVFTAAMISFILYNILKHGI
jgi:hypothetical protein